ncbi:MAG: helix-turn-helix transcriptional regulator [bacterium]|nr:helix-turn-helix transcriptional regulator [bacterium]
MIPDIKLRFAQRLKELRHNYDYTQQQSAELADIDYKHLQRLEGKNPCAVRIDTLEKLAKAFNISCSELLDF